MKLENLFALYLYQNKKLNLPGIGVFTADKVVSVPDENEKHPMPVQGITFTNKNVMLPDDDFIDFIKLHTGKMKPLAISDLESYLMLSKQFLNIGKPFYLDGIGTLQKVNDGSLKFIPGEYVSTKLEPPTDRNNPGPKNKSVFAEESRDHNDTGANNVPKKMLIMLLAIATLALIGWGGYYLFKSNTGGENTNSTLVDTAAVETPAESTALPIVPDSSLIIADSSKADVTTTPVTAGSYKFILETAGKKRAIKRFGDLSTLNNGIKMETADSLTYTIYVVKPAASTDTLRLKDSLNAWYYGTKEMKVKIQP